MVASPVGMRVAGATAGADHELLALHAHQQLSAGSAALDPPGTRLVPDLVEYPVGVKRVVVEEHQPLGPDTAREAERVRDAGVPPADVLGVLGVGVLAVVDEERRVASQVVAGDPLRLEGFERRSERGLVVGDVAEDLVPVGDPVAERRPAVRHRLGADRRSVELPLAGGSVEERHLAGQLAHLDG
jgi:GAF domain-containing protein